MKPGWCLSLLLLSTGPAWAGVGNLHHQLSVHLDPASRAFNAEDTLSFNGAQVVTFGLGADYSLSKLELDGIAVKTDADTATQQGFSVHRIALGSDTKPHVLKLVYSATIAALDSSTDEHQVLSGIPALADSQGSWLPAGSGWYPEVDQADFFTYRLSLDLPAGQRGLAPGRLLKEAAGKQGYHAEFDFAHPAQGIDLMAGPYRIDERPATRGATGGLRLRTYFHPEIADLAEGYLDSISDYMTLYTDWIGAYPYSEFSVVSSPLPTGFGMPTMTYLGIDVLRLPFIRHGSLGHEILHNWWGNGVYVDYPHGNWSEGLTTFMADYTYAERNSAEAAREMRLGWLRDFAALPDGQDQPLTGFTSRSHIASEVVGYHKAAFVFLMLRHWLGTAVFDAALRRFWKEQQFQAAAWSDLQKAFETASGQKLDTFFTQWLTRIGAPDLSLSDVTIADSAKPGKYRLTFTLTQSAAPYSLQVPVQIMTTAGSLPQTIELSQASQHFMLELDARPVSMTIDPDLRLFRQLDASEIPPILRQAEADPATVTVLAGKTAAVRETARLLAGRMLENSGQILDKAGQAALPDAPLLLIGTQAEVDAVLSQHQLPPRPATLPHTGTAQVWAAQQATGKVLVVVAADDNAALQALLRPLPHYGQQSYLVFQAGKAIEKGVWPTHGNAWVMSEHK